jgi:hypothetical protein
VYQVLIFWKKIWQNDIIQLLAFFQKPFSAICLLTMASAFKQIFNNYSRHRLMGSWLMGSLGYFHQIKPDFPVPKDSLVPNLSI